jgi:NAD(P)-dependent dehydrogenase (short-subunit alcohol dehydrogenase family)
MDQTEFSKRTVIVTGGNQGIGAAISTAFADRGAQTVVHYRSNLEAADAVVARIREKGDEAIALPGHLDRDDDVGELFSQAEKNYGPVDVLINNAGSFPNSLLLDISQEQWRQMYSDNVETTFLCSKAAAQSMKRSGGGVIINIASISALNPGPDHAHYNSAKAAVIMFTRSAAQELGPHKIRVNAVAPGLVDRPGLEQHWPDGVRRYRQASPLSCVVQPQDVANACVFLASDDAARITGVTLPVDSGVTSAPIY